MARGWQIRVRRDDGHHNEDREVSLCTMFSLHAAKRIRPVGERGISSRGTEPKSSFFNASPPINEARTRLKKMGQTVSGLGVTFVPVGRFVAYQDPIITSGKPINVPMVIGSLRKIMPSATATAGFI